MDKIALLKVLHGSEFFQVILKELSPEAQANLIDQVEVINLKAGEILYKKGDLSQALYLLVDGLMRSLKEMPDGRHEEFTRIRIGETIGEVGLLSALPRPLTVQAINDSTVVKLNKSVFDQYFSDQPIALKKILSSLISRAFTNIQRSQYTDKFQSIALLPSSRHIENIESFYQQFQKYLLYYANNIKINFFSVTDSQLIDQDYMSQVRASLHTRCLTVFCLNLKNTKATQIFLDYAERVVVIGNGAMAPGMDWEVRRILEANLAKQELVLLYPTQTQPQYATEWIETSQYIRWHHVAQDTEQDYQRLARIIAGKAVGIVFGGGGTRGWVHVGVLKALMEFGYPIDAVGGTSIGAMIGASYLISKNYDELNHQIQAYADMNRNLYRITNFTYPLFSILNGKNTTDITQEILQHHKIEALWRPYFCVSCDINKSRQFIHRKGSLWQAVRASTAVPALLPPMVLQGVVHVDGAVINNLPVNIMRKYFDGNGKIIAVDLSYFEDLNYYDFPPEIGFVEALLMKFGLANPNIKFMGLSEILLRAAAVGAKEKQEENAKNADVLIKPDLRAFKLLTEVKHAKQLLDIGYQAMHEKLEDLQKL